MSELKKYVGKRIQQIRKRRGYTQEKLAEMIGIETPSLSYLETGKYAPSIDTLENLAKALNVFPWEFYYFCDLTSEQKLDEIKKAMDSNPKLIDLVYSFYKSINS